MIILCCPLSHDLFLSTPSARRATLPFGVAVDDQIISIHTLREEGDSGYAVYQVGSRGISIHALREEGDFKDFTGSNADFDFYPRPPRGGRHGCITFEGSDGTFLSTPSARRATLRQAFQVQKYFISIHALREEGDLTAGFRKLSRPNFYPRPPRGGRLVCLLR